MNLDISPLTIERLGAGPHLQHAIGAALSAASPGNAEALHVGRIAAVERVGYQVMHLQGRTQASLAGRLQQIDERPSVGDFVLFEWAPPQARIVRLIERENVLARSGLDGDAKPQIIAANVNLVIVVVAFAHAEKIKQRSLNVRRIERYLRAVELARAAPLVLLNKADLAENAESERQLLADCLPGVDVLLHSKAEPDLLALLRSRIGPETSAVLVGPSGVGKSTLTNSLMNQDLQRVSAVREVDSKGRHTTTTRELFLLPSGGILIDTPGLREFGLAHVAGSARVKTTGFADLDALAVECRFRDCRHASEPGCAVRSAVENGQIARARFEHAQKLEREMAWQRQREDSLFRNKTRVAQKALQTALRAKKRAGF